jgi:hypothetical protein
MRARFALPTQVAQYRLLADTPLLQRRAPGTEPSPSRGPFLAPLGSACDHLHARPCVPWRALAVHLRAKSAPGFSPHINEQRGLLRFAQRGFEQASGVTLTKLCRCGHLAATGLITLGASCRRCSSTAFNTATSPPTPARSAVRSTRRPVEAVWASPQVGVSCIRHYRYWG